VEMQPRQVHVGRRHRRVQPVQNHRDALNIAGWQPAGVVTFEETLERAASEGPDHSSSVRRWLTESNAGVPVRPRGFSGPRVAGAPASTLIGWQAGVSAGATLVRGSGLVM